MAAFWKQNFVPNNALSLWRRHLDGRTPRACGEVVRHLAGGDTPRNPRSASTDDDGRTAKMVVVDKPGSPQTQVSRAGIGAARSSPDFRPMQVMNLALGGLVLEPHQHEPARSSTATLRRVVTVLVPTGAGDPSRWRLACGTDVTGPAVAEIFKEVPRHG
jgi:zinc protease